jgi:hypothetical protein
VALRNFAVTATGAAAETPNSVTALIATADEAVDTAVTANAVAGAKADVSTELGLAIDAIAAIASDIPSGALVLTVDTEQVTNLNKLRELLDAVFNQIAGTNLLPPAA